MKDKKKIITIIIIIVSVVIALFLLIGLGAVLLFRRITLEKRIYCNNEDICYDYQNGKLIKYVYQEDTDYDDEGVKKLKKIGPIDQKNIKILEHDEVSLVFQDQISKRVEHYYTDDFAYYIFDEGESVHSDKENRIIRNAYKKGDEEYYFISRDIVLYAKEKGKQKRMEYYMQSYEDEYHDVRFQWTDIDEALENREEIFYTYNDKTDELYEFTKIDVDELQLIDTSYYDFEGNIKENDNYYANSTNGFYRYKDKYVDAELYIHKNIVTMIDANNAERVELTIKNINDEIIEFDYSIPLELNRKTGELIPYKTKDNSLEKISPEDCKIMDPTVFQEDGTIKIDINIDGAYIYQDKENDEYVEFYIKDNTIKFYDRDIRKTLTGTIRLIVKDKKNIRYEIDFKDKEDTQEYRDMTYIIDSQEMSIFIYAAKKVDENKLRFIRP